MLQEASGAAGHASYRRYHYGSGPLLVEDGGTTRFISTDALGSTTDLTTTGAAVASMRKYDAWGQYRNDTAPQANEPKLGFTGHQYDPETGLVYARARYYDPDLGRFLSRDSVEGTIADAPSLHRFMYVRGNPLRYTDPSGNSDTAADAARRWEAQRAEYHKWLAAQLTPNDSLAKQTGLALTTLSVELGAGMMELFKLGEGAAEGGWRGWGKDALRAASLALLMKGSARMAKEPAPKPSPQGGRPPPAQAKVVEEPAGPAGDAVGTPKSAEPAPAPRTVPSDPQAQPAAAGSSGSASPGEPSPPPGGQAPQPYSGPRPKYVPREQVEGQPPGEPLPLPRGPNGEYAPSSDAPHTQIGWNEGRRGGYIQTQRYKEGGVPEKQVDWTDHGRPKQGHTDPHVHDNPPNPSGGTPQHGKARPPEPGEDF